MSRYNCKEEYFKYKNNICILDVFKDRCIKISDKNTISELYSVLKQFTQKKKIFNECRKARLIYSKNCYKEIDPGHIKHLKFLEIEELACDKIITKIQTILNSKQKTLDNSKKLLIQLKK